MGGGEQENHRRTEAEECCHSPDFLLLLLLLLSPSLFLEISEIPAPTGAEQGGAESQASWRRGGGGNPSRLQKARSSPASAPIGKGLPFIHLGLALEIDGEWKGSLAKGAGFACKPVLEVLDTSSLCLKEMHHHHH